VIRADGIAVLRNGRLVTTVTAGQDADIYGAEKIEVRYG
jgi:hypothetical protein